MISQAIYTARASVTGGRVGKGHTDDGRLTLSFDSPKEFGGNGGPGTNPEQLFALGYSACFFSALKSVARGEKISVPEDATIDSTVAIGPQAEGVGYGLAVTLDVHVPGLTVEQTLDLARKAHEICPYSNATRGNIEVTLKAH